MKIDAELLDKVTVEAMASPRLRMNFNLHASLDDKVQRLINVLLPDTVLPVHRHVDTDETYILLRGRLFVVFYDELGRESGRTLLDPLKGEYGVHIPAGRWHTIEVVEPSAIFEVKEGPYRPLTPEDTLY